MALFLTLFRFYVRITCLKGLFLDDFFVALAMSILIASAILYHIVTPTMFLMHRVGTGEAPGTDFERRVSAYLKIQFALTSLFWTCLWSVKFAFMAFFWRLGKGLKAQRIMWNIVLVFCILAFIGCMVSYPISCSKFFVGKRTPPVDRACANVG